MHSVERNAKNMPEVEQESETPFDGCSYREKVEGGGGRRERVILTFESHPVGRTPSLEAYLGQVAFPRLACK